MPCISIVSHTYHEINNTVPCLSQYSKCKVLELLLLKPLPLWSLAYRETISLATVSLMSSHETNLREARVGELIEN